MIEGLDRGLVSGVRRVREAMFPSDIPDVYNYVRFGVDVLAGCIAIKASMMASVGYPATAAFWVVIGLGGALVLNKLIHPNAGRDWPEL